MKKYIINGVITTVCVVLSLNMAVASSKMSIQESNQKPVGEVSYFQYPVPLQFMKGHLKLSPAQSKKAAELVKRKERETRSEFYELLTSEQKKKLEKLEEMKIRD